VPKLSGPSCVLAAPHRKATISKLRIDFYLSNRSGLQEDFTGFYRESYIRTLKNVRNLSVNVDFDVMHRSQSEYNRSRVFIEKLLQRELSNVLRYKIFPLHTVNVVIRNGTCTEEEDKLPLADRVAIAEAMRQILLDPEGAQKYEGWKACTKAEDAELHAGLGPDAFLQLISSALP
jgi:hypothetical protein